MKNIHTLPTEKPSRFYSTAQTETKNRGYSFGEHYIPNTRNMFSNHNIYITNDEKIKEGDWFYNTISLKPEPFKACENGDGYVNCSRYSHNRIDCKKIILTTDKDLIADDVQAIDDDFLEWFVKNPNCEEVGVELEIGSLRWSNSKNTYKIIIPKEVDVLELGQIIPKEEPKQERMYSEEEVELIANEMVNWAIDNIGNPFPQSGKKFDEVIAKYKKQ